MNIANEKVLNSFSEKQTKLYLSILINLSGELLKDIKNSNHLRLGQIFYNFGYGTIYNEPKPELFYETDSIKAQDIIDKDIMNYVLKQTSE